MSVAKNPKIGWWEDYSDCLPEGYKKLITAEDSAQEIRVFSAARIYGLMQTENYARACFDVLFPGAGFSKQETQRLFEVRLKRQRMLLDRPQPPTIKVILDEALLHRQLGGVELLREQLGHLVTLAKQPFIELRILPLSNAVGHVQYGLYGFILLSRLSTFQPHLLYQEFGAESNQTTKDDFKILQYSVLFDRLWDQSYDNDQTIECIKKTENSHI